MEVVEGSRGWWQKRGEEKNTVGVCGKCESRKKGRAHHRHNKDGLMIDIMIIIMLYLVFEKESFPLIHSLTEA